MRRGLSLGVLALVAAVAAVFFGVLPAFGHASAKPTGVCGGADTMVSIVDFAFQPSAVTVPVGTTVCWTNNGSFAHTVTDDNGRFDSGQLGHSAFYEHTFDTQGVYTYHCMNHTFMTRPVPVR